MSRLTNITTIAEERAFQRWCDERRRPQGLPIDAEPVWVVRYQDQDMPDEVFSGGGAENFARRRFDQQRGSWSLSLFMEVARG